MTTPDLAVSVGPLSLANPILTASGTFGYGLEFQELADLHGLGGLVTKGLSLEPLKGNPPQRIQETRGGFLNSIGLQNIGIESFIDDVLGELSAFSPQIVVNLFGTTPDEYAQLARRVEPLAEIAAIELNVSCPNVKKGGIQFGQDPKMLGSLVRKVRDETTKPLMVKLSPNVTSPVALAVACQEAGADILTAVNTLLGMSIDIERRRPHLSTVRGGLSGPAIKPVALRIVYDVARAVDLPVIGIGGIERCEDVVEFLLAGASAVQVGTALFRRPALLNELLGDLIEWLERHEVQSVSTLIGAAQLEPEST